ncbi:DNA-repair protein XRCC1 [Vitis riparia]|uniref:DNA-repair protein XRCC1 n=1 Tax=Vitis riparia TaxID=96939 RepID=UPI00155B0229|nr:DNA-repair protein XRCC1 [Vitis riparia]XP_034696863.1 DNA-repair protein XRCC1 [Vitis riparia]XP_034696864.1 DNA-repair protein XRCC1 [Vitis riparia]XP_034696866.1 DNA-repair protein XRCC1 [Vitis riparia]
MSDSKSSPGDGANKTVKRSLPSWMSDRENGSKARGKRSVDGGGQEESKEGEKPEQAKGNGGKSNNRPGASNLSTSNFSNLLEGVVFVLSGFVNPERSTLRSQALEMGAEYQPDWNSNCTLLVCAFPNTPKFRQVEADCGTIVSKEWLSECYNQKKLADIEIYLMHAGKPWRKSNVPHEDKNDEEAAPPSNSKMQVERGLRSKSTASKSGSNPAKDLFSPSEVKKWAIDDLHKTISWLDIQEEKPEPSEIKKIAAGGILTCLQDAIDSLEQKQDILEMTKEWNFIPRVVEELVKLESTRNSHSSLSKADLYKHAVTCKEIYEAEFSSLDDDALANKKQPKTGSGEKGKKKMTKVTSSNAAGYDSDETVEMTEEEIDLAYNTVASAICK